MVVDKIRDFFKLPDKELLENRKEIHDIIAKMQNKIKNLEKIELLIKERDELKEENKRIKAQLKASVKEWEICNDKLWDKVYELEEIKRGNKEE